MAVCELMETAADTPGVGALLALGDRRCWMVPGDVLGRHHRCTLAVADDRVSEAHAMLSLRGAELHLLNLRGGLRIDGRPVRDPRLVVGQSIAIAPRLELHVEDVQLPDLVWRLVGPGLDAVLSTAVSLLLDPTPRLVPGRVRGATAHLWHDGRSWHRDRSGPLGPDAVVEGEGWQGRLVRGTLDGRVVTPTRTSEQQLRIETRYDTAQIFRGEIHALTIGGVTARILHELAELDGPVHWTLVARAIWRGEPDARIRRRWDKRLSRLRSQLREANLRDDLVASSGGGLVELLRYEGDTVHVLD